MKRRAILLLLAALASLALPMCQSTPGAGGGGAAAEMERLYATWTKNENRFDAADHERLSPNQEISPEKELALMYDGRITGEKEFWQHFIQDRQQRGRKKAEQDLRRIVRAHGVSTIMSFAYGRGVVGPEAFDKIVQESQDNQTAFYRYINRPEVPLDGVGSYFKQAHPTVSATVY